MVFHVTEVNSALHVVFSNADLIGPFKGRHGCNPELPHIVLQEGFYKHTQLTRPKFLLSLLLPREKLLRKCLSSSRDRQFSLCFEVAGCD
jgi:hypothetical protein